MINNSSDNVVVSVAGQSEINLLERRLLNFQQEITDVKNELDNAKVELEKVNREKQYQQELLTTVEETLAQKRAALDALIQETQERSAHLEEIETKSIQLESNHKNRHEELSAKESKIIDAETTHNRRKEDFDKNYTKFVEDQKSVQKAKEALIKVIGEINL